MAECCSNKKPPSNLLAYQPVIVIVSSSLTGALALSYAGLSFMPVFMGLWFLIFGFIKLFDLKGFVQSFSQYDLITKKYPLYGRSFPFIESGLGLCFLAGLTDFLVLIAAILLSAITLAGVILKLKSGEKADCACVGSTVSVPLGLVAVLENGLMILMALLMLIA